MEDLECKIGSILENPQLMQQIMSLAQTFGQDTPEQKATEQPAATQEPDIQLLQKLSGIAGQSNIDKNQKNLLNALSPYLSRQRITKLENAMRAAKMARFASTFLGR